MILLFVKDPFWKVFLGLVDTTYLIIFLFSYTGITLKTFGIKIEFEENSFWRMFFTPKYLV